MPRPAIVLPTAFDLYTKLGPHPPWHTMSTRELADLLDITVGVAWNWSLRGHGLVPEADGMHRRVSTRKFFFPCVVLEWVAGREGKPVPAWTWCRTWLAERKLLRPDTGPEDVLAAVRAIDRTGVYRRTWRIQREVFEARLAEILTG